MRKTVSKSNTKWKKAGYRSPMEHRLHNGLLKHCDYEPFNVPYRVERKYNPDFVPKDSNILIEVKGFFREGDTAKYKAIRDCLPEYELVFVFSDPNKKVRKGAKLTMSKWAEKEGLRWYTEDTVGDLFK